MVVINALKSDAWVEIQASFLTISVTSNKLLNLPVPWFPHRLTLAGSCTNSQGAYKN